MELDQTAQGRAALAFARAIAGDDLSDAVAVVVANEGKKPIIRELEWGAP